VVPSRQRHHASAGRHQVGLDPPPREATGLVDLVDAQVRRDHPGLVQAELERVLQNCGPATPTDVLLRSPTVTADLPQHLVHAPVGAEDVTG